MDAFTVIKMEPAFCSTKWITELPIVYSRDMDEQNQSDRSLRRATLAFLCAVCLLALVSRPPHRAMHPHRDAPVPTTGGATRHAQRPFASHRHSRAVLSASALSARNAPRLQAPHIHAPTPPSLSPEAVASATRRPVVAPMQTASITVDPAGTPGADGSDAGDNQHLKPVMLSGAGDNGSVKTGVSERAATRTGGVQETEPVARALARVIRAHKKRTVVDVSCERHRDLLPALFQALGRRGAGIPVTYVCVSGREVALERVRRTLGKTRGASVSVEFVRCDVLADELPRGDAVLFWDGLPGTDARAVQRMLDRVLDGRRHGFVMLGSAPGAKQDGGGKDVNLMQAPVSYGAPTKMYRRLGDARDLCLYKASELLSQGE